ncbi:MAG: flotillin family protein, partial [Candidatus Hydrogenedentes bacterium]|nr:flotillin family protein [Candidatus Hydrogenedentota bacterium]
MGAELAILIAGGSAVLIVSTFIMLVAKRYKRCPSNRVLVIYGKVGSGETAKCVHGGA